MTEKYCLDRGIPFPRIVVGPEDLAEPRECYLFAEAEDPQAPIVLHFPLVNRTFRTHLAPGEGSPGLGLTCKGWAGSAGMLFQAWTPARCARACLLGWGMGLTKCHLLSLLAGPCCVYGTSPPDGPES